jgi:predicted TIM-barrel fold metal-dependent hydrolase
VRRAVEEGTAAGVKIYPPSGYAADEAMNDALYAYCAPRGVPLFAHCTPVGFEAREGYGKRSDPIYWRNVLESDAGAWRDLRLCLAHAGGADPWFGGAWQDTFAQRAYDLSIDFENVYCEFGYHAEILDPARRAAFAATLAGKIDASDGKFARRIVYGTDWHMIEKEHNHAEYYRAFAEVFEDERLKPHARAFFYDNAIEYLNLRAYSDRREAARGPDDVV